MPPPRRRTEFERIVRIINTALDEAGGKRVREADIQALYTSGLEYEENLWGIADQLKVRPQVERVIVGSGRGFYKEQALKKYEEELDRQEQEQYLESINNPQAVKDDLELVYKEDYDGIVKQRLLDRMPLVKRMAFDEKLQQSDPSAWNLANTFLREVETRESEQRIAKVAVDVAREEAKTDYQSLLMMLGQLKAKLDTLAPSAAPPPKAPPSDTDKLIAAFKAETAKWNKQVQAVTEALKTIPTQPREVVRYETASVEPADIRIKWMDVVCPHCVGYYLLEEIYSRKAAELGKKLEDLTPDEKHSAEFEPLKEELPEIQKALQDAEWYTPKSKVKTDSTGLALPMGEQEVDFSKAHVPEMHIKPLPPAPPSADQVERYKALVLLGARARSLGKTIEALTPEEVASTTKTPLEIAAEAEFEQSIQVERIAYEQAVEAAHKRRRVLTDGQKKEVTDWSMAVQRERIKESLREKLKSVPGCVKQRDFQLEAALQSVPGFIKDKSFYEGCENYVRAVMPSMVDMPNIFLYTGWLLDDHKLKESDFRGFGIPQSFLDESLKRWKEQKQER